MILIKKLLRKKILNNINKIKKHKLLLFIVCILSISYYSFFSFKITTSSEFVESEKNIPVLENIVIQKDIVIQENITVQKNITIDSPIRLKIPKVDIDTKIISVGITPTGILDVPKDISYAGLYNLWPIPWEIGNAIIDGHIGWINKKPGVFNNLYKLKEWDEIYYYDENWVVITFIITKTKVYYPDEATTEIFYSNDWKAHLNIITCHWTWDKIKKSYPNRLVIFTDKLVK